MITKLLYKIIACYLLLFHSAYHCYAQDTGEYLRQGKTFLRSKSYEQAVDQYSKAIELQPDLAKAYLGRAAAFDSMNFFREAAADYDSASVYLADRGEVYYSSGRCYYMLGMHETAISKLERAVEIRKNYRQAYELMAILLTDMKVFDEALEAWTKVLDLRETSSALYHRGQVNEILKNYEEAEQDFSNALKSDRENNSILCALASAGLQKGDTAMTIVHTGRILERDPDNICAMTVRSKIYAFQNNYEAATVEISRCLAVDPGNEELYFIRALYYREMSRSGDAVDDLSRVIAVNPAHIQALYNRALTYEETGNYNAAAGDYRAILRLSESITVSPGMIADVQNRLFYMRRETNRPEILLLSPVPDEEGCITLPGGTDTITIRGEIHDESGISSLTVNDQEWIVNDTSGQETFQVSISLAGAQSLSIQVSDIYNNNRRLDYPLKFTETTLPVIFLIAPYATEDNRISISDNSTLLILEGYVEDNSLIRSITINGVPADYMPGEMDPPFSAGVNIAGIDEIDITATDAYGNAATRHYLLRKETTSLSRDNPMGRTWVVLIENSDYLNYPDPTGPKKEIALLKTALARYQVHNIIHQKNLTRAELEKFFSIELRDMVRSNEVVSLVIWFAGQAASMNNMGYWLPSDALPSREVSYYNLNALRASLYSYTSQISHLLIICGGCDPGQDFYQPIDHDSATVRCEDTELTRHRSYRIFTTKEELPVTSNSVFNTVVAGVLANNTEYCLPVERIADYAADKLNLSSPGLPVVGLIKGLSDEGGTFFFVRKK